MRVLVTRPEPDASDEVEALASRGHEGVKAPLLIIEPVKNVALELDTAQALIVTSRNALRALATHSDLDRARKLRCSPSERRRRAPRANSPLPM